MQDRLWQESQRKGFGFTVDQEEYLSNPLTQAQSESLRKQFYQNYEVAVLFMKLAFWLPFTMASYIGICLLIGRPEAAWPEVILAFIVVLSAVFGMTKLTRLKKVRFGPIVVRIGVPDTDYRGHDEAFERLMRQGALVDAIEIVNEPLKENILGQNRPCFKFEKLLWSQASHQKAPGA